LAVVGVCGSECSTRDVSCAGDAFVTMYFTQRPGRHTTESNPALRFWGENVPLTTDLRNETVRVAIRTVDLQMFVTSMLAMPSTLCVARR
jgi:hypothetical protein